METPTSHLESHTQKHHLKCLKKRLTVEQVSLLENSFSFNNKLDSDRKFQLAQELGLPPRQVAIWYQNKRARWKKQTLEVDHKALQQRLDHVLAENSRLEKEVQELKEELRKANEMLSSSISRISYPSFSSFSSSCDEVGSPSLLHGSQQQLDKELYTYLIDEEGQFAASARHDLLAYPSIS